MKGLSMRAKMASLAVAGLMLTAFAQTAQAQAGGAGASLAGRLTAGDAIFGIFSGDKTAEQGALRAEIRDLDFVFYSLERGPFDLPQMRTYMGGLAAGSAGDAHPIVLRIPPIRDDHQAARDRTGQGIDAGAVGVVFPHVESRADAELAVEAMRSRGAVWPDPGATLLSMMLIEDQVGIDNVRDIAGTPGVSMISPGPGDLRRVYDGDADAIENAIQTVLSACLEFDVPCGITAGVDDIAERIAQGFSVFILTDPDALPVGRRASGRN